jgi:hypothetical protein
MEGRIIRKVSLTAIFRVIVHCRPLPILSQRDGLKQAGAKKG